LEEIYNNLTKYEKKHKWYNRFGSLFRMYVSKLINRLFKTRSTWIFNSLLLLTIILGPIIAFASRYIPDPDDFYVIYSDIMFLGYFGILIPLFTMYIASMMFNDEIGDKSITYLTVRPINRFELVITKYLSYLSVVPVFTTLVTFLNYISFGIFGGFIDYFTMALWFLLAAFVASAIYGAFFMLIGLIIKRPLWFGLFFVFIWEFVLASFSQTLNNLTISFYIKSLLVYDFTGGSGSPITLFGGLAENFASYSLPAKPLTFSIVLVVVVIISLTLSWAFLQGDKFRIPYKAGTRPGGWKYYLKEIRSYLTAIGILLITAGIVFGPVNGNTKLISNQYQGGIYLDSSWYWNGNQTQPPDSEFMGWGVATPYTAAKGDVLNISYATYFFSGSGFYEFEGLVCTKEVYQEFYLATQERWLEYFTDMSNGSLTIYYTSLINDYFDLVDDLILNAEAHIPLGAEVNTDQNPITITADEKTEYYFMLVVKSFDINDYIDHVQGTTVIYYSGEVFRRGGYALGYVMSGVGVVSIGFATYSIATYDSAIEIERYNQQIAKYEQIEKENNMKTLEQE
jgi:ABC-type transport system involved in multi-copper enzyme maturation permease subunit